MTKIKEINKTSKTETTMRATKQIIALSLIFLLATVGSDKSSGQSGGSCTYMNNQSQSPACGGGSAEVWFACNTLSPIIYVICTRTDGIGMLANCQAGINLGGLICSVQDTICTFTRTYSNTGTSICSCPNLPGGTPPPGKIKTHVQWPQPSGKCPGG